MSARTIHLDYVPPLPSPAAGKTRFVLLSDTHSATFPVPNGDVLLHAGDLTRNGDLRGLRRTMEWIYTLPHSIKIIIAGNRDFALHREWYDNNWERLAEDGQPPVWESPDPISDLLTGPRAIASNVIYLRDQEYRFRIREGGREWSVFGSPQTPNYKDRIRAFGYESYDAEAVLATFPATDILVTHGPPHGILDLTNRGANAGCPALTARLPFLRPRLHVFGHIHSAREIHVHQWDADMEGRGQQQETLFVNASNWPAPHVRRQEPGGPGRQPIVVDLDD